MLGLAIKVQPIYEKNEYQSAQMVVRKHIDVLNQKGKVYFSTQLQVDGKKASLIESLILYNREENIIFFADVERVRKGSSKDFLPEDASVFSPQDYACNPANTWFMLSKISKIDEKSIDNLFVLGKENITVLEKMNQRSRFPRFYFQER